MENQPAAENTVRRVDDVPFAEVVNADGQPETLRLDLYLPAGQPKATILWFHGGGFRPGNDKTQRYIVHFASLFAQAGYACAAPDYRIREDPTPDMPGTLRDAVADGWAAVEWARSQGPAHGLTPGRLVLAGGSAGGMLVTNLVHDPRRPLAPADGVLALLNLWGPPFPQHRLYQHINPNCPPTLIVHGTADELVPYEYAQALAAGLQQAGIDHQLLTLPGAPHTPMAHAAQIAETIGAFLARHAG